MTGTSTVSTVHPPNLPPCLCAIFVIVILSTRMLSVCTPSRSTRLNAITATVRSGLQTGEISMRERSIASIATFATDNSAPEKPWINMRRPSTPPDTNADTATKNLHPMEPASSIRMQSMHLAHMHLRIYSHCHHTSKLRSLLLWSSLM